MKLLAFGLKYLVNCREMLWGVMFNECRYMKQSSINVLWCCDLLSSSIENEKVIYAVSDPKQSFNLD